MWKKTFFSHLFSHVFSVCCFLFIFQFDSLFYYGPYMPPFPSFFCLSHLDNIHLCGGTRHPVMKVCTSFIIFNNPPVFVGVQSVEEVVTAVLVWSVRELKDKRKQCSKLGFPTEFQKDNMNKRELANEHIAALDQRHKSGTKKLLALHNAAHRPFITIISWWPYHSSVWNDPEQAMLNNNKNGAFLPFFLFFFLI